MAAESLVNSIGRLRVIEKGLLSADFISRLAASQNYDDALRLIEESGYGEGGDKAGDKTAEEAVADKNDSAYIETLIDNELRRTQVTVDELSINPNVAAIFRMRADITNLKLLLKLRLQKAAEAPLLQRGGVYAAQSLIAMVESGDYSALPKRIADTLNTLEVEQYGACDPQRLSSALDSAYISYALEKGNSFVKEYFKTLADFDNILILVRMKAADAAVERYTSCLLPSGYIPREALIRAYGMNEEAVANEIIFNVFEDNDNIRKMRDRLRSAYRACLRGSGAGVIEAMREACLIGIAARGRDDIASGAPIICYMLTREREASLIRLILTVKRNGLPQSVIDERMVELNG